MVKGIASQIGRTTDTNGYSKNLTDSFNVFIRQVEDFNPELTNLLSRLRQDVDAMAGGNQAAKNRFQQNLSQLQNKIDNFIKEAKHVQTELDSQRKILEEELRRLEAEGDFDPNGLESVLVDWMQDPAYWSFFKQLICEGNILVEGAVIGLILDKIVANNAHQYALQASTTLAYITNNLKGIRDILEEFDPSVSIIINKRLDAIQANWSELFGLINSIKAQPHLLEGCDRQFKSKNIHTTINTKNYTTQLVDHTALFQRIHQFIDRIKYSFVSSFMMNMNTVESYVDKIVAEEQWYINYAKDCLDSNERLINEQLQIAQALKLDINNFRGLVEAQLRDFASQGINPSEAVKDLIKRYMTGADWRWFKDYVCSRGQEGAPNPYPPPQVSIKSNDMNLMTTEKQNTWAITTGNMLSVILNNLEGIKQVLLDASIKSVREAIAIAGLDSGFLLRLRIRNVKNNCESLKDLLDLYLIDYHTDMTMRGCW